MGQKRLGRPSKGERDFIAVRCSVELGAVIRERAAQQGLTITDLAANILARELGRADLAPPLPPTKPEELPLTG